MNREAVKTEIENILSTVKQPLIKQYPAAKHQIAKLEELGLIEFMPTMRKVGVGYSNAAAVIEAATSAKTAVMNAYGEGEEIAASKLYKLLNEKEMPAKTSNNSYEIAIYNMNDDMDMHAVQMALTEGGLTDAGDGESGAYLVYGKSRSVFVDPSEVGRTVEILNKLGYQTDEDEQSEE